MNLTLSQDFSKDIEKAFLPTDRTATSVKFHVTTGNSSEQIKVSLSGKVYVNGFSIYEIITKQAEYLYQVSTQSAGSELSNCNLRREGFDSTSQIVLRNTETHKEISLSWTRDHYFYLNVLIPSHYSRSLPTPETHLTFDNASEKEGLGCSLDFIFNNFEKFNFGDTKNHCVMGCALRVACNAGESTLWILGTLREADEFFGNSGDVSLKDIQAGVSGVRTANEHLKSSGALPSLEECPNLCSDFHNKARM
jgi:hypothetical protein